MMADRVSGLVLLLLGCAAIAAAHGFYVPYQYEPLGPKAMPYLVGAMLVVSGAWLLLASSRDNNPSVRTQHAALWWRPLLLVVLLLGYALAYEELGFVVSSFLVTLGLAWLCGARLSRSCLLAFGLVSLGHLALVLGLGLQLPAGLLQGWV